MATATCPECKLRMSVVNEREDTTGRVVATFSCSRCGHAFDDYKDKYEDATHTLGAPCPQCGSGLHLLNQQEDGTGRSLGKFSCSKCGNAFKDYVDKYDIVSLADDDTDEEDEEDAA